jgi:hypothetical protein
MPRISEKDIPAPEELSRIFSKATGDPEVLDERDRLLLTIWEERVREGILAQAKSPTTEPHRWRLPDERESVTHRFEIPNPNAIAIQATCPKCDKQFQVKDEDTGEFVGYLSMGMYPDGSLGEIFLTMAKQGSFISGIMDGFVTTISIGLQHGIPLETFARKFKHAAFEPSGMVMGAPPGLQGFYKSVLDYLFRYLEWKFPEGKLRGEPRPAAKPQLPTLVPPLPQSAPAASPAEASSGGEESPGEASTDASEGAEASTDASEGEES